jgi:hypothetical protein
MKTTISSLLKIRWTLVVLSVILLLVLGAVGDNIMNIVGLYLKQMRPPGPTDLAFRVFFPPQSGHFLLSLTPFMILFIGAASVLHDTRHDDGLLYPLFAIIWFVVLIYFGVYSWVLTLPFTLMGNILGAPSPIRWVVPALDTVLITGFALLVVRRNRMKKPQMDAGSVHKTHASSE